MPIINKVNSHILKKTPLTTDQTTASTSLIEQKIDALQGTYTDHPNDTNNPHNVTYTQIGADPFGAADAINDLLDVHKNNTTNPHNVTAAQVGAEPANNNIQTHISNTANPHAVTAAQVGADPSGSASAVQTNLTTHINNKTNPHAVTAIQVGADPSGSASAVQTNLTTHINNKTNPHAVTAAQVGADVSGSAATVQTNLESHINNTTTPHNATSSNTANTLLIRDANGRSKINNPVDDYDIVNLSTLNSTLNTNFSYNRKSVMVTSKVTMSTVNTWVDVPGLSITGNFQAGYLNILCDTFWYVGHNDIFVRLVIDNIAYIWRHYEYAGQDYCTTHMITIPYSKYITAGNHTIKVQTKCPVSHDNETDSGTIQPLILMTW